MNSERGSRNVCIAPWSRSARAKSNLYSSGAMEVQLKETLRCLSVDALAANVERDAFCQ